MFLAGNKELSAVDQVHPEGFSTHIREYHFKLLRYLLYNFKSKGYVTPWHILCGAELSGLLAQSVERGADNAKVVSSILTQTREYFFVSIKPSEQTTYL